MSKKIITLQTFCLLCLASIAQPQLSSSYSPVKKPKIQAAILLDVSNSMDGLIEQAKSQLWSMVTIMGKVRCDNGVAPDIEIALYEYGRSSNDMSAGYVKQISSFTSDLDELSKKLFSLTTNGGDEYCGQVLYMSLSQLRWDKDPNSYKTIFIAGNEDFLQGKLRYSRACEEAGRLGVMVNTIYCGNRQQGIREHWNLGNTCGNGSFTVIDQHEKTPEIPTPYDDMLFSLNDSLNSTYVYYGYAGAVKMQDQVEVDKMNYSSNKTVAAQRVSVKGNKSIYKNEGWDLVDAEKRKPGTLKTIEKKTLPKELQQKSDAELEEIIKKKQAKREAIQKNIEEISKKRESYLAKEKAKKTSGKPTLESETEKIIKAQTLKCKMKLTN